MTDTSPPRRCRLPSTPLPQARRDNQGNFWSGEAPSFKDALDTINPLQHIPVVSTVYQAMTGDMPSSGAKIAGGALFGGPIGLVALHLRQIVQSATGAGIAGNLMAAIEGKPVPALHNGDSDGNGSASHARSSKRQPARGV